MSVRDEPKHHPQALGLAPMPAVVSAGRVSLLDYEAGVEISENEAGVLNVELHYPRSEGHIATVEVDQVSVRASDSIRIRYDYDRDGWAISQASTFCWDADAGERSGEADWQEVAFVPAWGRKRACAGCEDAMVCSPSGRCANCGHENGAAP